MEGADVALLISHDQDRGLTHGNVFDHIVARLGQLLDPPDVEPDLLEDMLPLQLKLLRRGEDLGGERFPVEMRILVVPLRAVRPAVSRCPSAVWRRVCHALPPCIPLIHEDSGPLYAKPSPKKTPQG